MRVSPWLLAILCSLLQAGHALAAEPANLDLYRKVFSGAATFGVIEGEPPAAEAFRDGQRAGYVFFTQQVIASAGYTGKPLDVLVGIDLEARITGAVIVEQHEPILVIGVSPQALQDFVAQYRGRDVREPVVVERVASPGPDQVDAVAGATISSLVISDAIMRAARAVARSRGLLGGAPSVDFEVYRPASWSQLITDGAIAELTLAIGDVETALAAEGGGYPGLAAASDPAAAFITLDVALATPALIGRNLLGDRLYNRALGDLPAGTQLLFVGGRGLYSFKGTAWRKSGVFERLQLVQGEHTLTLQGDGHQRVDALALEGAPALREMALFRLPATFDPAAPFTVELLVAGRRTDGSEALASFALPYALPQELVIAPTTPPLVEEPVWHTAWRGRSLDIAILGAALLVLTGILVFQDTIVRRRRLYLGLRLGFLLFTLLWLGWYAGAQLSVLNVLTFAEALRGTFRWEMFLLAPLMFILWGYVAMALLFWGRGVFCGWLCPFGTLQELTNRLARLLHLPQWRLPFGLHERLWPIKYVAFIGLFALSLGPMALAQQWAEVEPFKTAIVLRFDRAWPFVAYALGLLAAGLFVERAFCRYLCPLGAALGIPAKLRLFEWLRRHHQCARPCQICAVGCPVQAIHPDGRINPNECIHCLACQTNYYDAHVCPPMIERRQRRERRAAMVAKAAAEREA